MPSRRIAGGLSALPPLFLVALLILQAPSIDAQAEGADEAGEGIEQEVFAPFVSRLRITVDDPEVTLSWQEPADVVGRYQIFRHNQEITSTTFEDAEHIATVESPRVTYTDVPQRAGTYFYAVLVEDATGRRYDVFVPFRNTNLQPAEITATATRQDLAAKVSGLTAARNRQAVLLSFRADRTGRELIIYRSTEPITATADLTEATAIDIISSSASEYQDFPVPGIPYYYSVFDTSLAASAGIEFVPGDNTTIVSVEIPLGDTPVVATLSRAAGDRRPLPLPYLSVALAVESGDPLPGESFPLVSEVDLEPDTVKAVARLLGEDGTQVQDDAPPPAPIPVVLDTERSATGKGAEATLRGVVDGPFRRGAWGDAIDALRNLLTLPLEDRVAARARFYIAQSLYFLGRDREAFVEFLLARQHYYTAAQPWIDRILGRGI